MCGICGIVALGRPPEKETVERMAAALDHRGPDGKGTFAGDGVALAFRRLAIIDLSDAGLQPFASDDGALQLLHNGEIYNYRELRRELEGHGYMFRSATDTEVILRAYEQWGERCVERFNGMWAIVIWDARARKLFCSRDRFGIKPFYYSWDGQRLVFASEPKAFRGVTPLHANPRAVRAYLEQSYLDHTTETFFEGILRLPPAHNLVLNPQGLRLHRYWQLEPHDPPQGDPVEAVRETFLDALRLHLRSDVPVGTCLSGGIDSSAIVVGVDHLLRTEHASAAAVGERQQTFTAYFDDPGYDERPYAQAVVAATNVQPHWITFDAGDLVANIDTFIDTQDEPFGSTSMIAQWYVMREAKHAGLTVMLDGQGGDELFAGYDDYAGPYFADLVRSRRFGKLISEARAYRSLRSVPLPLLARQVSRPLLLHKFPRRGVASGLAHPELTNGERSTSGFPPTLSAMLEHMRTHELPKLLRYEDRNSMAHSLEARVPFLDIRLVELVSSLDGDWLFRDGQTKSVLRHALRDLLPKKVLTRHDKMGFVTPEQRFFRGPLGELAAAVFESREFEERGFVDAGEARRQLHEHRLTASSAGPELWRALNLELWARRSLNA